MSADLVLFSFLNSFAGQSELLDGLIVFFATYVPFLMVAGFALFLIRQKKFRLAKKLEAFLLAMLAALIARLCITSPLRFFFPRDRPFVAMDIHDVFAIYAPSFPSGHSSFFFAFSMVVYYYNKTLGIWFFVLTIVMCAARVAAGVHYPSDILAGAIVGIATGYLCVRYLRPPLDRLLSRLHRR